MAGGFLRQGGLALEGARGVVWRRGRMGIPGRAEDVGDRVCVVGDVQ